MKLRTIFFISIAFAFAACKKVQKNVHNYYPVVKTVSAEKLGDGSVRVTGQIVSGGSTDVAYAGFCWDTVPNPRMVQNQVMVDEITNGMFSYTFSSFSTTKKYYFRAWAGNDDGYDIGADAMADTIIFDSSAIPCSPAKQKVAFTGIANITESYTLISPLTASAMGYQVIAHTGSHTIIYDFGQYPISGFYKTVGGTTQTGGRYMAISVDGIRSNGGADVYVRQGFDNTIGLTLCRDSVTVRLGLISYYTLAMSTDFRFPG